MYSRSARRSLAKIRKKVAIPGVSEILAVVGRLWLPGTTTMTFQSSQMLSDSLTRLELPAVLEEVAAHACSEPGRMRVLSIQPEEQLDIIEANLRLVNELREMIVLQGMVGLEGLCPMEGLFHKLSHSGAILESEEILAVHDLLVLAHQVLGACGDLDTRFEQVKRFSKSITGGESLRNIIARILDERGEIRPNSDPALIRIHTRLRAVREITRRRLDAFVGDRNLAGIVQEDYVTMRNDRYVILLKPEFRGKLDGIVHDHSRSGASVYVEPFQVVELNNEIAALADEERAEIRRIFKMLTEEIRRFTPVLNDDFQRLALLDAFQARASYAIATSSRCPELVEDGFRILGARHPLLIAAEESVVVPMDVIQDASIRSTVISGPNMGGKTVALKIAGLFPLMVRCGMMVPAKEGSQIKPFSRIMVDIGEDQDIRSRISSFSGHMLRIKEILSIASENDLVLLDEIGGSTDPEEGAALAMAIIDELAQRRARVLVTTHLTHLKAYAMARGTANNVSVEFHPQTLKPTFRLLYDLPGESHALSTAEAMGIEPRVIESARAYLDKSAGGSSQLLADLRKKLEQVEFLRLELEKNETALDAELRDIASCRDRIVEGFRLECVAMISNAERQISEIQKSLKLGGFKKQAHPREALVRIKTEMEEKLGVPLKKVPDRFTVGTWVHSVTLGKEGRITAIYDSGHADVAVGNVTVKANLTELSPIVPQANQKSASKNERIGVGIPIAAARWEVKIIGLRIEEALPVVEKAIDDAVLGGLHSISVIHGRGTGRLRQSVRQFLSQHPLVRDFRDDDAGRWGEAVTVVELVSE